MKARCCFSNALFALVIGLSTIAFAAEPRMSTVAVANSRGYTAETLAASLIDGNSPITLITSPPSDAPTFAIKSQLHPNATTDLRAVGIFEDGNVPPGTSFNDPVDQNAVLAGGIGIDTGVCLSTGFLSDGEPTRPTGFSPLVGLSGPNDGLPIDLLDSGGNPIPDHEGEISKILQTSVFNDDDWANVHTELGSNVRASSGDPAVLEFKINLANPGYLRTSFVFGSDEYPFWTNQFNDTIAVLIKGVTTPPGDPGENLAILVEAGVKKNFSLLDLSTCDKIFLKNQLSPAMLAAFPNSHHKIIDPVNYYTFYDHEFAGFSQVLTRETAGPLAPGRYTIKFVIEDTNDQQVDSALFIAAGSIKLYVLNPGDFNGDGKVNNTDYQIWRAHFGQTPATFSDGDANGDGVVSSADYVVWSNHQRESGPANFSADFNRDGCVDGADFLIWQRFVGMPHCASRFEGDADGDGKVDSIDLAAWQAQVGMCSGFDSGMMRSSSMQASNGQVSPPASPDIDGDGIVSESDLAALDAIILGNGSADSGLQPEPTLAEPQP